MNKDQACCPRLALVGEPWVIEALAPQDADAARALIVAGLTERWGVYEPGFNPDLEDFPRAYADAVLRVARIGAHIVGTGVLQPTAPGTARIVRMSVHAGHRRRGIGGALLAALRAAARERGWTRLELETTADWHSAVAFYRAHGFSPTELRDGDQHFVGRA